jgi:hypothetical protein
MILKAGDIRQEGDEQRRNFGEATGPGSYVPRFIREHNHEFDWHPIQLIGHPILSSDVMIMEFRRGE